MEMSFEFDLRALDEVFLLLENKVDRFGHALLEDVHNNIKGTPQGKGKLGRNITKTKSGGTLSITANEQYASFVENGRGPVHAKNAKALRFIINGEVLFRKSVGPAKATHFMQNSIEASISRAQLIWSSL